MRAPAPAVLAALLIALAIHGAAADVPAITRTVERIAAEKTAADGDAVVVERLMAKVVEQMSTGEPTDLRRQLASLQTTLRELTDRADRARSDAALAPRTACEGAGADTGLVGRLLTCLFGRGRASYLAEATELERQAAAAAAKITALRSRFTASLERIGIHLSGEQIDGLLLRSTAETFTDLWTLLATLKGVSETILHGLEASNENLEVAKRYYAFYAIMLEAAVAAHDTAAATVERHARRLDSIGGETVRAREEALRLLEQNRDMAVPLTANLRALDLSMKAVDLCRRDLAAQARAVGEARGRIARQLAVARNSERTVAIAAELTGFVRHGQTVMDTVMRFAVPPLRPFEGTELQAEYERLSRRLAAPAGP